MYDIFFRGRNDVGVVKCWNAYQPNNCFSLYYLHSLALAIFVSFRLFIVTVIFFWIFVCLFVFGCDCFSVVGSFSTLSLSPTLTQSLSPNLVSFFVSLLFLSKWFSIIRSKRFRMAMMNFHASKIVRKSNRNGRRK